MIDTRRGHWRRQCLGFEVAALQPFLGRLDARHKLGRRLLELVDLRQPLLPGLIERRRCRLTGRDPGAFTDRLVGFTHRQVRTLRRDLLRGAISERHDVLASASALHRDGLASDLGGVATRVAVDLLT